MSVTVFIRTRDGDYNYESEEPSKQHAQFVIEGFRKAGGYWTENGIVFIPWHRVDYAEIRE
jgi:hypothetical protein